MKKPINLRIIKILFLLVFVLFSVFLFGNSASASKCANDQECINKHGQMFRCIDERCVRVLELGYPVQEGDFVAEVVSQGLPRYVVFIFNFAVGIVGILIFGALIYAGIQYMTSGDNPSRMGEARSRIISAFFGAIILLSAYIIFHTINPQLLSFDLRDITALPDTLTPGIYVCNYSVPNIDILLNDYTAKTGDEQKETVQKLREAIYNPDTKEGCPLAFPSSNFKITVKPGNTVFAIPRLKLVRDGDGFKFDEEYLYGIIFHEKDNQKGQADYWPKTPTGDFFSKPNNYTVPNFGSTNRASSFTLFQKNTEHMPADAGIILYHCYNLGRSCPKGVTEQAVPIRLYSLDNDIRGLYNQIRLGHAAEKVLSANVIPSGKYLALVCDEDDLKGDCASVSSPIYDALDLPIEKIGDCGKIGDFFSWLGRGLTFRGWGGEPCFLRVRSVMVFEAAKI